MFNTLYSMLTRLCNSDICALKFVKTNKSREIELIIHDLTIGHISIVIDNTLKQISNLEGEMTQNPAIKNKEKRELMNILSFLTYYHNYKL